MKSVHIWTRVWWIVPKMIILVEDNFAIFCPIFRIPQESEASFLTVFDICSKNKSKKLSHEKTFADRFEAVRYTFLGNFHAKMSIIFGPSIVENHILMAAHFDNLLSSYFLYQ